MGFPVGEFILYTLQFVNDQIIRAQGKEDAHYMVRKLQDVYHKWVMQVNLNKTEQAYITVGRKARDLSVEGETVVATQRCNYLGSIKSDNADYEEDMKMRLGQGRTILKRLHPLNQDHAISKKVKRLIYKVIIIIVICKD